MKKRTRILSLLLVTVLTAACLTMISCGKKESGDNTPKTVTVKVVSEDKTEKTFKIETDGKTLADALDKENLVEWRDGMIITVDGVRADYNLDGAYWSISKAGVPLMTGAGDEVISDGAVYELTYTKG